MIDVLTLTLLGVVLLGMLLGLYLFIEANILYPHQFTLKYSTAGNPIVIRTRAKEVKDETGAPVWKLLYKKIIVPVPPAEVRNTTSKGRFDVEAWFFSDGQIQFEKNKKINVTYESIPKAVASEILTAEQRIMLVSQLQKAEKERGKSLKDVLLQMIIPLGSMIILSIVLIMGFMMWSDITKPGIEFADRVVAIEKEDTRQLEILLQINNDIQLLKASQGLPAESEGNQIPN